MAKKSDETLLPRPPQILDVPAMAPATRRAAERLQEQFNLSAEAAVALAASVVDPSQIRKAADNPEELNVPGGVLYGLRTEAWTRRIMPDPRNPRVGPARRHPVAVAPGSTEDAFFRPIPEPDPDPDGRPELRLAIENREHLAWASGIAKKFILKDNDWRLSIRNQGVMTEVWLSAVTMVHGDGSDSVTIPVTSEGSSRLVACHDILEVRSCDVPYSRDDRALRSIIRSLNDAVSNGPTEEQAEALRCETIPALLLVGFEPHPGSTATFATAVRSLVALRHVEPPKPWNEAAKMGSIADAVLEALTDQELLRPDEELWLLGALTPQEAEARGFSADPAVRAARIIRLLTDSDPSIRQTIRVAITGQTTKQRITNKFKLEVAAALILRAVKGADERQRVSDIYRALQTSFPDSLASEPWSATYRSTEAIVLEALDELDQEVESGPHALELAARAAFPLVVSRQLFPDRGTKNNDQVDRRQPGKVIERMRSSKLGIHQLGQALTDYAAGKRIRVVSEIGELVESENDSGDQLVTDNWLRTTFPPPGRPIAPVAADTAHERFMDALSKFGESMDGMDRAVQRLLLVEGVEGRPLIETEGVDPADADAWVGDLMKILQLIPVWRNTYVSRHGFHESATDSWDEAPASDDEMDGEEQENEL
ncbi:MAG: hypothetical protein F4124_15050 [Acidimicrobiia bacterium]|nr:hypothetical protein [Acidimicrobiia bacterium]MYB75246.1 hypothetical protein [Acidimicrobiia bacterium]MYI00736.1 hypothetical protein [Acidimicrobiia bacterium]